MTWLWMVPQQLLQLIVRERLQRVPKVGRVHEAPPQRIELRPLELQQLRDRAAGEVVAQLSRVVTEAGAVECIGERRRVRVPAQLGFGSRGSRTYGVPPDAVLLYDVKLVSINGQTDPGLRREDLPDEQRFQEPGYGPW